MTRPPEQTKFNALRAKWDHNQRRDSNAPPLASMHALGDTKSEGHGDTERHSPHDNRKRTPSRLHRFGSFSLFSGALNSLKPKLLSRSHKPESKPSSTSASTTAQSDSSKTTTASLRSSPQSTPLTMPSAPAPAPAAASITVYSARTPYESMGPPPPKLPRNNSTSFLPVPVKSASTTSLIPPPSVRTFPQSKSTNLLPRLKSSTIAPPPPPEEARLVRPLRVSLPPQSGASLQASLNQAPRQSSRHPSRQPSLQPQQTPRKPSQRSLQPSFRQSSQRFGQQTPRHHSQRLAQQPPREPSQGVGQQLPRQSSQQFPQQPLEPPSQQFPRQLPLQQSQQQFKRTSKPLPQQRAPNRSRIPTPVGTARAYASALKQDDPNAPPMPRPLPTIPRSKTEPNLISATSRKPPVPNRSHIPPALHSESSLLGTKLEDDDGSISPKTLSKRLSDYTCADVVQNKRQEMDSSPTMSLSGNQKAPQDFVPPRRHESLPHISSAHATEEDELPPFLHFLDADSSPPTRATDIDRSPALHDTEPELELPPPPPIETEQPTAYWAGRFTSMRDNMLNSTFDMENRPRDIGDLNRRIPGLTNYEQGIKDVFDRLEGLCITPPAHRSLCMFRNSYARKNGMRFLERPLPPLPRSPGDRPSQSSEEQPVQRERRFSLLGRMARKGRKVSGDEQREMQA